MADENLPKSPSDNAVDKTSQTPIVPEEYKDGNGVANKATPPEFSKEAVTIPPAEDLFSKQEQDVSNLILTLPRTPIPEFSVRLYRRRQMDWSKFSNAIGSTTGRESQRHTLPPKELQRLQTTAAMGIFQFHRTVGYNFMRKALALNYHQTTLLKTLNKNIVNLGTVLESKLEAIKINTSVPESKKAGLWARFKEELRVQSVREAATKVRDWGKALAYPVIKNDIAIPVARDISDVMHGRTTLVDTAHNLQQGLRNVSQSTAEKFTRVADKRGDEDTLLNNSLRSAARRLNAFSDKEAEPLSPKTTDRLTALSGWLLRNTPAASIGNFMDKFLSDSTAPPDVGSVDQSNVDDDYAGSVIKDKKTPSGSSTPPSPKGSETRVTHSLDATTAAFYKSTTAYLKNILTAIRKASHNNSGGLKNPRPASPIPTPPQGDTKPTGTPLPTPDEISPPIDVKVQPIVEERPVYGPPTPPQTDPIREAARRTSPPPTKEETLRAEVKDKISTPFGPPRSAPGETKPSPVEDVIDRIIPTPASGETPSPRKETISDFSSPKPDDIVSESKGIRALISGYMHTTTDILKSLSLQNIKSNKVNEKIAASVTGMKNAIISIIPKRFRKNSYEEHEEELAEEAKEKRTAEDTAQAESHTGGGILSRLMGLFKSSRGGEGGSEGKGWLQSLLDIGELGEDVTLLGLLKSKLTRSKAGRGLLKVGSLIKKPAVAAIGATKSAWARGGLAGLAGLGAASAAKGIWSLVKSPITAFRAADRGLKAVDTALLGKVGLKAGTNLVTSGAGALGRGALSLGKRVLTSGTGIAGLSGLVVNSLTDHVTSKKSTANRLGHTAGNALEWGSLGFALGGPIGAALGAGAATLITNMDLIGHGLHNLGQGFGYLYHSIVGEKPQISPTGKLIKPGKRSLIGRLLATGDYTQEQLAKHNADIVKDPNVTPWKSTPTNVNAGSPYTDATKKLGINPSVTVMDKDALREAYKNKKTPSGLTNGISAGLDKSLLNGQTIDNQPEYKATIKLLPEYLQKHIAGSSALQFVLWSTALQHGPQDAAKIFNDDWTDGESDSEYIRKVFQSRSTRFVDQSPTNRIKAFATLGREQSYAQALSSGATQFSFSDANAAAGNPVTPMGNGHLSVVPHVRPSSAETKKRANEAIAYLQKKGWTQEQAAGIVANLVQESGLDPKAVGDSGLAGGIAQWHPDRRTAIAAKFKKPVEDMSLDEQLDAVDWELREGSERGAGKKLASAKTAQQAGAIVSQFYERPRNVVQEAANRGASAEAFLTAYTKSGADKSGATQTADASSSTSTPGASGESTQVADSSPSPLSTSLSPTGVTQATAPTGGASDPTSIISASNTSSTDTTSSGDGQNTSTTSNVSSSTNTPSAKTSIVRVADATQSSPTPLTGTGTTKSKSATDPIVDHLKTMSDALQSLLSQSQKQHNDLIAATSTGQKGTNVVSVNTNNTTVHAAKNDIDISKPSVRPVVT